MENTIQGCVHPSLIEKFGDGLHEGAIIEICKFNLQDYNKNYKISYHKFQIRLTERTTIACVEQQLPQTSLENFLFRNYEEFAQLKDSTYDLYGNIFYFFIFPLLTSLYIFRIVKSLAVLNAKID
ncbi:hypothetical protein HID58_026592, partial [Brassica napus]